MLRAVEVIGDSLSPVATVSYIFIPSVLNQPNNPEGYPQEWGNYTQIWGTAIADYEMDSEMTKDTKLRRKIIEGLKQLPILSIMSDKDNFFSHENDEETGGIYIFPGPPVGDATGHGWTRPASIEQYVRIGQSSVFHILKADEADLHRQAGQRFVDMDQDIPVRLMEVAGQRPGPE